MRRLALVLVAAGCAHPTPHRSRAPEPRSNFVMPEVRGLTVEQAEARLRTAGKQGPVDWREEHCDAQLPAGVVCSSYPWTGAQTMAREPLVIYVQAPPDAAAAVPDVQGQPVEAAKATLQQAGFRAIVQTIDDPRCAPGVVCHVGCTHGHTGIPKTLYVGQAAAPPASAPPPPPPPKPAPNKPSFFK
jgi:hypothetical protein